MQNSNKNLLKLPIEEKIGQLFFVGLPTDELDETTNRLLTEIKPGGICLFARNIKFADKTRKLLDSVCEALPFQPFLSVDQEGGLVDRLRRISEPIPSPKEIFESGKIENVIQLAKLTAEIIRILGFNMNFAPVVDVTNNDRKDFVMSNQKRTFGYSKEEAYNWSKAYLYELQKNGVIGCLKHFPGIGAVEFDPHEELPSVSLTLDQLKEIDFYTYYQHFKNRNIYSIMTGHVTFPNTDLQETDSNGKLLPASLSHKIVSELLRDEFGFQGLALTDDLEMGAIINNYGIGEAAKMAFQAGSDFLLICNSSDAIFESYNTMLKAFENNEISEARIDDSLKRISEVRNKLQSPLKFNEQRINEISQETKELKESL